jgi:transcriptional regulator with XRE-family HTH domain
VAWLGDAAKDAIRKLIEEQQVAVTVPRATFDKQLSYLERKHKGPAGAARAAGVSPRTWAQWKKGTARPSGASIAKVRAAYEAKRRPEIERLRKTLSAKQLLKHVKVQISGTVAISSKKSKRHNFAEEELANMDLSGAWEIRNDPDQLADYFTEQIQLATDIDATWPDPDVDITLI